MQKLLSQQQLNLTIHRLAYQLMEDDADANDVVYIGLQPRGIYISNAITDVVKNISDKTIHYGKLDITFYRDDFKNEFHSANQTDIPFSVENKKVVLIDDVLYTGRTIRAALDALLDFGRPQSVKLCVLVNRRFNREFPIQPDFCGITVDSIMSQKVRVDAASGEVFLS